MNSIVKPPTKKVPDSKNNRSFLNESLAANMRELVETEDGRYITKAQAITERISNIAMFAESNTDAIQAAKFIFERLGGKATVMKDDEVRPMPKVSFLLNSNGIKKVNDTKAHESVPDLDQEDDGNFHINIDGEETILSNESYGEDLYDGD